MPRLCQKDISSQFYRHHVAIFWPFNSFVELGAVPLTNSNVVTIKLAGNIFLTQPWHLRGNLLIEGVTKRNTSFMYHGAAWVGSNTAPAFYITTSNSITFRNLFFNPQGTQISAVFSDNDNTGQGANGIIFERVSAIGAGNNGYGRPFIFKAGFDYDFRQFGCDAT